MGIRSIAFLLLCLAAMLLCTCGPSAQTRDFPAVEAWPRHTIDGSSQGADGVRLLDVNADGLLDIATGWEEGGVIRAYLHPGPKGVRDEWLAVTVGQVAKPEDAVFVDLDGDGAIDVVSACEGKTKTIFVHWAPADSAQYLDPKAWETAPLPGSISSGCSFFPSTWTAATVST